MRAANASGPRRRSIASLALDRGWPAPGAADLPALERLEVEPSVSVVLDPKDRVQLQVRAYFRNGAVRHVTRWAVYEPSSTGATVRADGEVRRQRFGETAILVRDPDGRATARLAFLPARPAFPLARACPEANAVDRLVFAKLKSLRMQPSDLCSDAVFLRRALSRHAWHGADGHGDAAFFERSTARQTEPTHRPIAPPAGVRGLLGFEMVRPAARRGADAGSQGRAGLPSLDSAEHRDRHAAEPIRPRTARGARQHLLRTGGQLLPGCAIRRSGPRRSPRSSSASACNVPSATTIRSIAGRRTITTAGPRSSPGSITRSWRTIEATRTTSTSSTASRSSFLRRQGEVTHPSHRHRAMPHFLGGAGLADAHPGPTPGTGRLGCHAQNPLLRRAQVNRIWYHLMGRGIVDPIDDFRASNPAVNAPLLEELAKDFMAHRHDLRHTIRTIMNSRTYQLQVRCPTRRTATMKPTLRVRSHGHCRPKCCSIR